MDNSILKKILPHLGAYIIMMAASFLFFLPLFQNKTISAGDEFRAKALQTEIKTFKGIDGKSSLWTNATFSGMPSYQILNPGKSNYTKIVHRATMLFQGANEPQFVLLVAMFLCYLLLICLKVDWRIALIGSIGYGLSTYFIDLAEAGHNSKILTMAWVPGVYAGAILAFDKKYLLGGALFALCFSINLYANHFQITFYLFLMLVIMGIVKFVYALKSNTLPSFSKAVGILTLAGLLGLGANLSRIWTTQEYSKETIRGKSELSSKAKKGDGLDKNYIFAWSYGIKETFTLMIPNFYGGGTSHTMRGTKTHDRLYNQIKNQALKNGASLELAQKSAEQQVSLLFYWGKQPFVGVAIYFGIVLCFLFFLAIFLVKGDLKVWLLASAVFALSLAWGNNFFLNEFFVDYLPLFNKFRAVSMALGISHLSVIALAMLGLKGITDSTIPIAKKKNALFISLGITIGLCLLAMILGSLSTMVGKNDSRVGEQLVSLLQEDRKSLLYNDVIRSLILVFIAGSLLWAYLSGKIKSTILILILAVVSIGEVWMVNKRVFFSEKYETIKANNEVEPYKADLEILKDKDLHYRVLDLADGNPFENARTSYFHKSVGGYHAAKLMRYQDFIEKYLSAPSKSMHLFRMLNTKYIIEGNGANSNAKKIPDPLGNAWFVNEFSIVNNGDEELAALANLDPKNKAIVQKDFSESLANFNITPDENASIKLVDYHPDELTYEYSCKTDQFAVFSEIYYPPSKGWNLYLNDQKIAPFFKTNFLLRGSILPASDKGKLVMKFEPKSFKIGELISKISSILILLFFVGGIILYFKNNSLPEVTLLEDNKLEEKKTVTVNEKKKLVARKSKKNKKNK